MHLDHETNHTKGSNWGISHIRVPESLFIFFIELLSVVYDC